MMVKFTLASVALLATGANAYSSFTQSRSTLKTGMPKVMASSTGSRKRVGVSSLRMEDFGLFKGTGKGFDDIWGDELAISEVGIEKKLNEGGLRYRLNRTPEEAAEVGPLLNLPGFEVNLPLIGKTYLGPPNVANIWEAIGFTATSNNAARQAEKIKAIEKARGATKGVKNGPGAAIRKQWLDKYGYPRLVGSGGIFYADQLSTDEVPMGGFNMGKSGQIWPVPDIVKLGNYGGEKGWGMKAKGPAVDGLAKSKKV